MYLYSGGIAVILTLKNQENRSTCWDLTWGCLTCHECPLDIVCKDPTHQRSKSPLNVSLALNSESLQASIAQLGERQTEDLKVPGSIPGFGIFLLVTEVLLRAWSR